MASPESRPVALVTGAARGVGAAIARALGRAGHAVVMTDLPDADAALGETVEGLRAEGVETASAHVDVRVGAELDAAVALAEARFGGLDVVVANAGVGVSKPFWELSEADWTESLDVTLSGAWRTAKAATPALRRTGTGSLVFVGSTAGARASAGFASYVAAKHGLIGLMRAVALELGSDGIRSNAVLLGTVDTPGTRGPAQWRRTTGLPEPTEDDYRRAVDRMHALPGAAPMDAEAVGEAVAWLVSPAARYVTGVALPVDAGRLLLPGLRDLPA